MKKLSSAFLVFTLLFTPIGTIIFQDQPTIVDAKRYSSGKRSYTPTTPARNNNQSNYQNKQQQNSNITTNKSSTTKNKGGFSSGSFMKGLMLGGLAGLLFGGLLGNMGFLGSILGLLVNVLAIVVLLVIIRKVFHLLTKKKKEDPNPWRN